MSKSLLVSVEPTILRYARKTMGLKLEDVVSSTRVDFEILQSYEENKSEISLTKLEKFAKLYKRPLAFFLLNVVPEDAIKPKDYRIVFSEHDHVELSPKYHLSIRRARYVQSTLSELIDDQIAYNLPKVSLESDIEKIAATFREYLGITWKDQNGWKTSSDALRSWKDALEDKNIFVLQSSLPDDQISAYCLVDRQPYLVILNSLDNEYRRIFSLFHEVGHILLRKSGICSPEDLSRNSYEYIQIEKFCNQFAASILLPKVDFLNDFSVMKFIESKSFEWTDYELKGLANKCRVSKEVVLRRFQTFGYLTEVEYDEWRQKWLQELPPKIDKLKKKNIKIPQHVKCISQNGRGFVSLVLDRYHANRISFDTAAEFLNISPQYIAALENRVVW